MTIKMNGWKARCDGKLATDPAEECPATVFGGANQTADDLLAALPAMDWQLVDGRTFCPFHRPAQVEWEAQNG